MPKKQKNKFLIKKQKKFIVDKKYLSKKIKIK